MTIQVDHNPDKEMLESKGVFDWPIWTKEVSEFPWHYASSESCYILEGEITVIPQNGDPVSITKGDFVVFPKGLSCTWKITKAVRKHYLFD